MAARDSKPTASQAVRSVRGPPGGKRIKLVADPRPLNFIASVPSAIVVCLAIGLQLVCILGCPAGSGFLFAVGCPNGSKATPEPTVKGITLTELSEESISDKQTTILDLRRCMEEFVAERNWEKFHNAKNLSMSLAIESAELMEHFQWLTTAEVTTGENFDSQEVADELADVVCYALSLANSLDIDIAKAVHQKMIKNRIKYPVPANDK